jgi:hypothetical protein
MRVCYIETISRYSYSGKSRIRGCVADGAEEAKSFPLCYKKRGMEQSGRLLELLLEAKGKRKDAMIAILGPCRKQIRKSLGVVGPGNSGPFDKSRVRK